MSNLIENGYTPNDWLTDLARDLGIPKKRLLVLSSDKEPFNTGTPTHIEHAEWFAQVYRQVGYLGIHLRRLHYRCYDRGVINLDGEPYQNTEEEWNRLSTAAVKARLLGLVDPENFIDNRAPNPVLSVYGLLAGNYRAQL